MVCAAIFAIPPILRGTAGVIPGCSSFLRPKYAALCYCTVNGKMKSRRMSDHLERTANDFRQEVGIGAWRPEMNCIVQSSRGRGS
ncbi:UNVERIFIED_CONTAM: hypothetical protein K2H54_041119 [Gekko kuhli]